MIDKLIDIKTIRAAVAGEDWAVNRVVEHYSKEIDKLCTYTVFLDDGTPVSRVDPAMKIQVTQEFIQSLKDFPI